MEGELKEFISSIEGFYELQSWDQLDIFAFFFQKIINKKFNAKDISDSYKILRIPAYPNIAQYLKVNSHTHQRRGRTIKFYQTPPFFELEGKFEIELTNKLNENQEANFLNFKIDESQLNWSPSDVPHLTNKQKKNAHFFTKLYFLFYHLENSIRKFISKRLNSILGSNWEKKLSVEVDLSKAQAIRGEVNLIEMLPSRGDNILHYCMWDDYAKIIDHYSNIFSSESESREIIAHLGTLTKIRNAIAHNASTIPKDYQDELTVFLNKYIKILKQYEN